VASNRSHKAFYDPKQSPQHLNKRRKICYTKLSPSSLVVFLTVGGQELLGFTMLGRPIVIAPLVGLLLGDLQTGLLVGAALETIFMGVVNIGGAAAAEPGLASALAAAFCD
jgi:mannose/fructose/N-acetylgalactosamine-specific phosphotransferase system component IIC